MLEIVYKSYTISDFKRDIDQLSAANVKDLQFESHVPSVSSSPLQSHSNPIIHTFVGYFAMTDMYQIIQVFEFSQNDGTTTFYDQPMIYDQISIDTLMFWFQKFVASGQKFTDIVKLYTQ